MKVRVALGWVLAASLVGAASASAADTQALDPVTSATSVDVTEAPVTVDVSVRLIDAEGLTAAFATFAADPNVSSATYGTSLALQSGTTTDGVWTGTISIPITAVPAPYTLVFRADDEAFNNVFITAQELFVKAYVDTTGPSISGVSISPTSLDPAQLPADVTVSAHLTDDRWLDLGDATFELPGHNIEPMLEADFTLIGGDLHDGRWATTITIPKGAIPGDYRVAVFAWDWLNHTTVSRAPEPVLHIASPEPAHDEAPGADAPAAPPADDPLAPIGAPPEASVAVPATHSLTRAIRSGLTMTASCSEACRISPELRLDGAVLARTSRTMSRAGKARIRMRLPGRAARRIRRARRARVVLRTTIGFSGARDRVITRRVRLY